MLSMNLIHTSTTVRRDFWPKRVSTISIIGLMIVPGIHWAASSVEQSIQVRWSFSCLLVSNLTFGSGEITLKCWKLNCQRIKGLCK